MSKEKDENIYYCVGCGEIHPRSSFYISYSENHANGRLFYCKDFIRNKSCDENTGEVNVKKFQQILMQLDIAFVYNIFETASQNTNVVGNYFRIVNSLKHLRGLGWEYSILNSDNEDGLEEDEQSEIEKELSTISIPKLEERWGKGYTHEELYLFEKKYLMLKNHYNEKTAMHTEALYNYIRYRVKEEVATSESKVGEAKSWGALASKAATDAKINPSQLSKADLSEGLSTFSELSQAVEKEVDIIRILPRFKFRPNDALDFNIWCYINYMRDLSGLPPADYEDIYSFYDRRVEDYVEQYGDPYNIFVDDPLIKNRESIKKFIQKDGDE